ncbi:putative transcription factor C3H family [Helianthus annuus]|uniref:Putative zinc finger CCCH domain-containing protein 27 n=1 Tax=Helianthus annuus TaxID=4232 RepID=A0A251UD40_HELAN|nr:zinc finger CCCH domain-containing protein 41 [Helianthus annuus]XP_021973580.1 zinc finger CCCH domain-containing protein 41 [Helianthus annuus]KAF5799674.1 putative transcription factor C3H family [Helianthus annuus]
MELEASTQEPANSPSISESNPDEKEISDDDDDDRNHKHRRRDDARSQSQEREAVEQVYTKPYRRGNKPFENGHTYRESGSQSNHMDFKFDKRRPSDLNSRIRGRGRGRDPGIWNQRDIASQMGPGLFGGRGLSTVSNAYGTSWGAFGLVPGLPNGGMDPLHPLGLQGAYRSINPSMNMGLGLKRQRCRDFEEQGFCLRGDMCPMEHGVNRIVVEDVQSLSQFNLPVSLQNANIPGAPGGSVNSVKPSHGKTNIRGAGPNAGLKDTYIDPAGGVGADFYDPDQPLWGNDSQSSPALQPINQSKGSSVDHRVGPLDVSDEHVAKSGGTAIGRVNSIKKKTELRENMVSKANSSTEKRNDANSSLKTQTGSGKNVPKHSQKAQCTLFVNGIPLQQNKRETLLSHFHKFGEVIDIHIPSNGERAFVQFSRREEAEAALMAPDAVMGNRFIKLFWANRDNIPVNGTISGYTVPPVVPRGMPVSSASRSETIAHGSDHPKSVINAPKPPPPSQKKLENLEVLKEELRKKQEMLDQKRNDFRRKLAKLEKQTTTLKGEIEPEQVAKKPKLGIVADSAKTETVLSSAGAESIGNGNKSSESSGPQRSKTTATVAQQESLVLKPSLRPLPPVGPSVVINRFKLDNRPTAFKITSTLPNDLANVAVLKEHFSQFGDLSKVEIDDPEPANSNNDPGTGKYSARVYFRTRHSAEKAFSSGKCWNGHDLQFSWFKSSNPGIDSESRLSATKGNVDASVGSENIEQKDINKEQVGPGESNNAS